jgi:hypothetical protein
MKAFSNCDCAAIKIAALAHRSRNLEIKLNNQLIAFYETPAQSSSGASKKQRWVNAKILIEYKIEF